MANADVLRLQTNVPETIALDFVDGLLVSSKFGGDQVMFSLCDGRKMFLAPAVARKIAESGVEPKQPFQLVKTETLHGNRRIVEYRVLRAETAATAPALAPQVPSILGGLSETTTAPSSRNGLHVVNSPVPAAAPVPVAAPAAAAPPAAAPAAGFALDSSIMTGCYTTAVDVALGAVEYAKARGLLLTPTFEDVRSLAATFYIAYAKGGR